MGKKLELGEKLSDESKLFQASVSGVHGVGGDIVVCCGTHRHSMI